MLFNVNVGNLNEYGPKFKVNDRQVRPFIDLKRLRATKINFYSCFSRGTILVVLCVFHG